MAKAASSGAPCPDGDYYAGQCYTPTKHCYLPCDDATDCPVAGMKCSTTNWAPNKMCTY